MITPQEIPQGRFRKDIQLGPVTCLLAALQHLFAALDEEARLASGTEMSALARRAGEAINTLFARYEIVRYRAVTKGQFVVSVDGVRTSAASCM